MPENRGCGCGFGFGDDCICIIIILILICCCCGGNRGCCQLVKHQTKKTVDFLSTAFFVNLIFSFLN